MVSLYVSWYWKEEKELLDVTLPVGVGGFVVKQTKKNHFFFSQIWFLTFVWTNTIALSNAVALAGNFFKDAILPLKPKTIKRYWKKLLWMNELGLKYEFAYLFIKIVIVVKISSGKCFHLVSHITITYLSKKN